MNRQTTEVLSTYVLGAAVFGIHTNLLISSANNENDVHDIACPMYT